MPLKNGMILRKLEHLSIKGLFVYLSVFVSENVDNITEINKLHELIWHSYWHIIDAQINKGFFLFLASFRIVNDIFHYVLVIYYMRL